MTFWNPQSNSAVKSFEVMSEVGSQKCLLGFRRYNDLYKITFEMCLVDVTIYVDKLFLYNYL